MKRVILNEADLAEMSPLYRGVLGPVFARMFLRLFGVERVNRLYGKLCDLSGCEFTQAWLRTLDIRYEVENSAVLETLPDGAFVTVSNHPFGGLDGVILVDLMAQKRSDYKFMVNSILMHVETLSEHFVGVKPVTPKSGSTVENNGGLKYTLRHLKNGGAMGFFPAGAVSGFYHHPFRITDKDWQLSVIRLIQAAKVPVIPIYIHGRNSRLFNILGWFNWQLRSVRMAHELMNKSGKSIKLTVGRPIEWEEQKRYKTIEELGEFLRKKTLELAGK